jgi:hypothetical protein
VCEFAHLELVGSALILRHYQLVYQSNRRFATGQNGVLRNEKESNRGRYRICIAVPAGILFQAERLELNASIFTNHVMERRRMNLPHSHEIRCRYFSQEDLLGAGCLDIGLAIEAAESAMKAFDNGDVMFPEKIVQIFNDETQERINCLPATFKPEKICGMKWVSVFPPNPQKYGIQNLSAVIILSEIEHGFPIAFMEGTLCSNIRVGTIGALAAKYLARPDSEKIGFIGAGEQAKMHLIAMKTVLPALRECRVAAKSLEEENQFVKEMQPILPDLDIVTCAGDLE